MRSRIPKRKCAPQPLNDSPDDLSEETKIAVEKMQESLEKIRSNISTLQKEIAEKQNWLQKKQISYEPKLKRKKEEQKESYLQKLSEIQHQITVELAEKEKIAAKLAVLSEQLEKFTAPLFPVKILPISVDLSAKTQRSLENLKENLTEKAKQEFNPLFARLEETHKLEIESLKKAQAEELKKAEFESSKILIEASMRPLTKEDIEQQANFEAKQTLENDRYRSERDRLKSQISIAEKDRDKKIQEIADSFDRVIFEEQKSFDASISDIMASVCEPKRRNFEEEFAITSEMVQDIRNEISSNLKEDFERRLKEDVNAVAARRETMKASEDIAKKKRLISATDENNSRIESLEQGINEIDEETKMNSDRLSAFKNEWKEANEERRLNEEQLLDIKRDNEIISERVDRIHEQYENVLSIISQLKADSKEEELGKELHELLARKQKKESKHDKKVDKIEAAHKENVEGIKERVKRLKKAKNDAIEQLTEELSTVNERNRKLSDRLKSLAEGI